MKMNNKITNPKTEVPTGLNLNDKDYMTNLLSGLKCLEKDMAIVLTEASNEKLFIEYKKMFDEICTYQRNVYELMFKFGWYALEQAGKTKIDAAIKTLDKELQDLN